MINVLIDLVRPIPASLDQAIVPYMDGALPCKQCQVRFEFGAILLIFVRIRTKNLGAWRRHCCESARSWPRRCTRAMSARCECDRPRIQTTAQQYGHCSLRRCDLRHDGACALERRLDRRAERQ